MSYNGIYKKIENHVTDLFLKEEIKGLHYHNLEHTQEVVARTKEIAAHYDLSEKETTILYAAAWFHDTGYLFVQADEHEEKSVAIMRSYLQDSAEDDIIDAVQNCITATKIPQNPKNLLEEILCDADTYNLGTKEFRKKNKLLRKEREERRGELITKLTWLRGTSDFMESHHFHTSYCKNLLDNRKQENLRKLKEDLKFKEAKQQTESLKNPMIKSKSSLMAKGIQTMLRLTSDNHLKLSDMADRKASILISVNSIIISVVISVLIRRLEVDGYLTIPTILFLISSLATVVISILATRPKISEGIFNEQDIINKKTNLLFFGNFHKVSWENYENAMIKMMGDTNYLYGSLIKDIYTLGVVLGKKYRLIRLAYNVFMIGIIISVLAFAIAVYTNTQQSGSTTPAGNSATMPL
jgi:predicted metal-dependent HD superfamily phosphohydrolase